MKNYKTILILIIAFTTILSCSKKDDELTFDELMVENSPWSFNGVELSNVINNGTEDFDKDEFEKNVKEANENTSYNFYFDGTGEIFYGNEDGTTINWKIINNNQLILSDDEWESTFINLIVTQTNLEFLSTNMTVNLDVNADVKYLFSKSIN
ncbi:hypothetical protein R3X25_05125 [Lutibacter sp. TH_r2]|uniref:hypothetical protein n=1 Tax=Lutibacter sp. TH_r2 TaxID=3082083 RepID=UPI0029540B4B|nr:hypothetical protein [Lutibacter sp. TH_r2]MDV7186655.1 hypothetical protein [Lutibacter sp. TH_r2]